MAGKDNSRQPTQAAYDKCFSNVDSSILTRSRRLFHDTLKTKLKSYPTTYDEDKLLLQSSEGWNVKRKVDLSRDRCHQVSYGAEATAVFIDG